MRLQRTSIYTVVFFFLFSSYCTSRHGPDVSSQHGVSVRTIYCVSQHQVGVSENQKVSALTIVHTKTPDNRIISSPEASTSSRAAIHPFYCISVISHTYQAQTDGPSLCPSTQKLSATAVRPQYCCQHQVLSGPQRPV